MILALTALTAVRAQANSLLPLVSGPTVQPLPSLSCGAVNRGGLHWGSTLPPDGPGWTIPDPWRVRDMNHGTTGLVGLVQRAAGAVALQFPGSVLGVGDLSAPRGGPAKHHRSHQSGRDVDLFYFARDMKGQPVAPDIYMPLFRRDGVAHASRTPRWTDLPAPRRLDTPRNWALVRALVSDPTVTVKYIFVSYGIRRRLLDHARAAGEPPDLIRKAAGLLRRPRGARPHNDHIHLRIACSARHIEQGNCSGTPAARARVRGGPVACPPRPRDAGSSRAASARSQVLDHQKHP